MANLRLAGPQVREKTSNQSSGSGTAHQLNGVRNAWERALSTIGSSNNVEYIAQKVDASGNPAGKWERCLGTYTSGSPNTISRAYCIENSDGNTTFIDWSSEGTSPDIFCPENPYLMGAMWGPLGVPGSNIWYRPISAFTGSLTSANMNAGRLYASPILVPRPLLFKQMRFSIAANPGTTEKARMGIYKQRGPYGASQTMDRIWWEEKVFNAATGVQTSTDNINTLLDSGIYWLALNFSLINPSVTAHGVGGSPSANNITSSILGYFGTTMTDITSICGMEIDIGAYSSSALPSTVTFTGSRNNNMPFAEVTFNEP